MAAFAGQCRIETIEGTSVRGNVSLTTEQIESDDGWCGRLQSDAFDFWSAQRAAQPITISLPSGATGTVTITRFTHLLPTQAYVTGVGPRPW